MIISDPLEPEDGVARAEIVFSGDRLAPAELHRRYGHLGTLEPVLTDEDRRLHALAAAGGPKAAEAAYELGGRYERGGWDAEAREMYRRAWVLDDPETSPWAALNLGPLAFAAGDVAEAEAAFRCAAGSQDARCSSKGWDCVGLVLKERGDKSGAREAFERAMATGHPVHGAEAATNLGTMLFEDDDLAGADRAYCDAVRLGSLPAVGEATYNLAMLHIRIGDVAGAEHWLRASMSSDDVDYAADGALTLESFVSTVMI